MNDIEKLQAEIEQLEQRLAEFEAQSESVEKEARALMSRWRLASLAADVDGDPEAQAEAAELQRRLSDAQFVDQRRQNAIAEVKNRLRAKQGALQQAIDNIPREYERRRPGVPVGPLTRLAKNLPGRLGTGDWEPITNDRLSYELSRCFGPDAAAVKRSIDAGSVAKSWDYEFRLRESA